MTTKMFLYVTKKSEYPIEYLRRMPHFEFIKLYETLTHIDEQKK